jgi:methylenetetrahydrofolate dehydrogenase (NADP+)/methenyltetrahydrofolate cyclohydrolase
MILLDGKILSEKILSDLKSKVNNFQQEINLDIILVGNDSSSIKYVELKQKKASEVGIGGQLLRLPEDTTFDELQTLFNSLNQNSKTTAFFIQLPIPNLSDPSILLKQILFQKDADGLNPDSGIYPAVVRGIITLLENYQISFDQKNIVIVNDSDLIGRPLKKYFSQFTSNISLLNRESGPINSYTQDADILISATGTKNIITADIVKEGVVVVDVANGDVDFENVSKKSSYITPTYGGVGPMTVASLLENTYLLAIKK